MRFTAMIRQLIIDNGMNEVQVYTEGRRNLTIPGFYRPTKNWDIPGNELKIVFWQQLRLKSTSWHLLVTTSNNRVEEALGNATDLNTAFREGAFGESQKPFVTATFLFIEECQGSMNPVRFYSPHFCSPISGIMKIPAMPHWYELFCRKLVQERLYDAATLVLTQSSAIDTGVYRNMSTLTSARSFMSIVGRDRSSAMALG